ncbi:MAG: ECF transporter S component [Armatimonadota bacterium]|nr:ECF transporter S component [Armatimonadota bacterium]
MHSTPAAFRTEGRERVLAALMGALAIALPQAFHLVGLGAVFLPMHLPVALAGMMVRPGLAAAIGVLAPVLSFFIAGMPPAPLVPLMAVELAVLGSVGALLRRRLGLPVWAAVPGAVVARVAVTFLVITLLGGYLRLPRVESAAAWVAAGLPGIVLQLIAVPAAVQLLRQRGA